MNIKITLHWIFVALVLTFGYAARASCEELNGTRPGGDDQPLTIHGAIVLLDVSKIDGANQNFTGNVFVMLSWQDERLASDIKGHRRLDLDDIWNPRIQIVNQQFVRTTFDDVADVAPDGTVTFRQRYNGTFASKMDLRDFPLDRHRFNIQIVAPGYGPDEIRFVPVTEGLGQGRVPQLTVPDFEIGSLEISAAPFEVVPGGRQVAGLLGTFTGTRKLGYFIGKAFVSVAIIVFMSWVVFWISPENIGPRLSVSVTSMLTLIAYRFLLGQSLPPVSYLTRLDYFLLGCTLLVFAALVEVAATGAMASKGGEAKALNVNRRSRWVFPVTFVVLTVATIWVG
ncbi:MAG: hypothetical protein P8Y93_01550 [Acidobacteriota bacterium]